MNVPRSTTWARWGWWLLLAGARALAGDVPAGTIATGTPAATPYYVQDSGVAGPTVLVVSGVHGDEPAGPGAADQVRHWPVRRGKLVVVPRANVAALAARKRLSPGETNAANLNRDFPGKDGPNVARGELASALWSFVQGQKPDWLVDLHEGSGFRASNTNSVGSSLIVSPTPETEAAAAVILAAVNAPITNSAQKFVRLRRPIAGSLARAAGERLGARAMILETTTKGQALSKRTRQHRVMVHALLAHLGMIDPAVTP
jgi:predicted deacylase